MANRQFDSLTSLLRGSGSFGEQITSITDQLQQFKTTNDALAQASSAIQTQASAGGSSSPSGGSILSTIGGFLGGGLGLLPLISGLTGLFGGGDSSDASPALQRYVPPAAINLDAGFSAASGGASFAVDAAQGGSPRPVTSGGGQAAPQITVQVQAMDSQSFLDHSQDIANAVRQAMLETTVLNDVIREV